MEDLYQRHCGSKGDLFCIESGCWSAANGEQTLKERCWQILELCRWGELSCLSLFLILSRRTWGQLAKESIAIIKSSGSFNRKILSEWTDPPDLQINKLTEFVYLFQLSHCQKWHRDYELHRKTGCRSDPHVQKKEDQFQEQSLSEEFLFCRHLTEVYSELPRSSRPKCRIRWAVGEWKLRKEIQIYTVQCQILACD